MHKVFFDTESTGKEKEDRIIQLAFVKREGEQWLYNEYFKPALPIKIGAMATHHITEEVVADKQVFTECSQFSEIKWIFESPDNVCIAHNAKFDVAMLEKEGIKPKNIICTLKVAQHLDSNGVIESHGLQFLRYYLKLDVAGTAHDAMGDVYVLEALFARLFAKVKEGMEQADVKIPFLTDDDVLMEMVRISSNPVRVSRFKFGKHKGEKLVDVLRKNRSYLEWLLGSESQKEDGDEDLIYTLKQLLYGN